MIQEFLTAQLRPSSTKKGRVRDMVFYAGADILRADPWTGESYMLAFTMDPAGVRLERLKSGAAPLMKDHSDRLDNQIGVIDNPRFENKQWLATARFSERPEFDGIWQDIEAGIIQNVSMEALIHQIKDVTPKGSRMKHMLATDWEPHAVAVVPLGADPKAKFLSALQRNVRQQARPVQGNQGKDLMTNMNGLIKKQVVNTHGVQAALARTLSSSQISFVPKDGPFRSLGEQLQAISNSAAVPMRHDPRLDEVVRLASGASGSGALSDGGFPIQANFVEELVSRAYETSVVAQRCSALPTSKPEVIIPSFDERSRANGSRFGGIQAYWDSEAQQATASRPKFKQLKLRPERLTGLCYVTDELLQDAPALGAVLTRAFGLEFSFKIDLAILFGSGVGQPLGIMNSPALITVSKESGQAAGSLVVANILKMWSRSWGAARKDSVWLVNQDTEPQLYSMFADVGVGAASIFTPAGRTPGSSYSALFGRPVIPVEYCETVGTTGDIILADFGNYLLSERGTLEAVSSIHVQFLTEETAFRFILRIDGGPADSSPITPYRGTNTLSSFVALETRV